MIISLFHTIVIFLFIFSFKIPIIYNSTLLAMILIFPMLFRNTTWNRVFYIFNSKSFIHLFLALFLLGIVSVSYTIFHGFDDYSFSIRFFYQIFYLILSALIVSCMLTRNPETNEKYYVLTLICNSFLLQSLIIIFAFSYSPFREIIQLFQDSDTIKIAEQYGGVRGLALAGAQFFGLSIGYSFVVLILGFLYVKNAISTWRFSVFFLLYALAIFSVGRTGLIGLFFTIVYIMLASAIFDFKKIVRMCSVFILVCICTFFLIYLVVPGSIIDLLFERVLPFAFEFIYKYYEQGHLTTTSTSVLQNMYFELPEKTIFFGDDLYTNADGTYYMYTDAGYMRVLLYGGIGMLFAMVLNQFWQMYILSVNMRKTLQEKNKLLLSFIVVMLFIFQYKGEVISYLAMVQMLLFLITLSFSAANYNKYRY